MTNGLPQSTQGRLSFDENRWRQRTRQSWHAQFTDWIFYRLSPVEWYRLAQVRQDPLMETFWETILGGIVGILLPLVISVCVSWLLAQRHVQLWLPPAVCYWGSPWSLACGYRTVQPIIQLAQKAAEHQRNIAQVLPEAYATLGQAMEEKRAYRTRHYDVYLPPARPAKSYPTKTKTKTTPQSSNDTTTTMTNNHRQDGCSSAILFLPGALVPHTAYARPARLLSQHGYIVVVAADPWCFVSQKLHHSPAFVQRKILQPMERRYNVRDWSLVGHSLGGFTASHLVLELIKPQQTKNNNKSTMTRNICGMVMWAAAPFVPAMKDLSQATQLPIAIWQASDDAIVRHFSTPELTQQFYQLLPPQTRVQTIVPGTHAGFGSYLSTMPANREPITHNTMQQDEAVQLTHEFLQRTKKKAHDKSLER